MNTLKLTAEHFKKSFSYWSDYIGTVDVSDYQGSIEIDSNLGYVRFEKIKVTGSITALAGSGIKAGKKSMGLMKMERNTNLFLSHKYTR